MAARHKGLGTVLRADGWRAFGNRNDEYELSSQVTPPEAVNDWLPKVHQVISNLKRFLLGTLHGVTSENLQQYLDEFTYRYNRRLWGLQLLYRLLKICSEHVLALIKFIYQM